MAFADEGMLAEEGVKAGASGFNLADALPGDKTEAELGTLPVPAEGILTGWDGNGDLAPPLPGLPLVERDPTAELPLDEAEVAVFGTGGINFRSVIIFCRLLSALLI